MAATLGGRDFRPYHPGSDSRMLRAMTASAPSVDSSTATRSEIRLPAGGGLVNRLTLRALALALEGGASPDDAAEALLRIAAGNRSAVQLALRRVHPDVGEPVGTTSAMAATFLRAALARGAWAW